MGSKDNGLTTDPRELLTGTGIHRRVLTEGGPESLQVAHHVKYLLVDIA
jgi:hypothetical protein